MKKDIHPQVYTDCEVKCACGNVFTTISTRKSLSVEICSACHPFYTGQQKFVDTEGRIEKFAKKQKLAEAKKVETAAVNKKKADKKAANVSKEKKVRPTLKEILETAKEEQ